MKRLLAFGLMWLALGCAPVVAQDAETSPEGVPTGEPETLPAEDDAPGAAKKLQDLRDATNADGTPRATRWRTRRAKEAAAPARPRGVGGLAGPEAALAPDPSAGDGVYKAPGTQIHITGDTTSPLGGDVAEVVGHVKLQRRGMQLSSDKLRFDRKKGEFIATGNVVVADPHYTLSCGKLTFYGQQEMGVAHESAKILETRRGADGEISERMEMTAFQITVYSNESRVEGLERVRIYRMVRRDGKLALDFKVTADSCDSNMVNAESVFKGQVKVESPSYTIECKRLIFDQTADRMTCIGDAKVTGFGPKGEVASKVEGAKIVHLIREKRSIVMGGVSATLIPGRPTGLRQLDAAAVKETSTSEELLALPEAPKDPEKTKYRRKDGKRN